MTPIQRRFRYYALRIKLSASSLFRLYFLGLESFYTFLYRSKPLSLSRFQRQWEHRMNVHTIQHLDLQQALRLIENQLNPTSFLNSFPPH